MDAIWKYFGGHFHSKSTLLRVSEASEGENGREAIHIVKTIIFFVSALSKNTPRSSKNRSKVTPQTLTKPNNAKSVFWERFGVHFGSDLEVFCMAFPFQFHICSSSGSRRGGKRPRGDPYCKNDYILRVGPLEKQAKIIQKSLKTEPQHTHETKQCKKFVLGAF